MPGKIEAETVNIIQKEQSKTKPKRASTKRSKPKTTVVEKKITVKKVASKTKTSAKKIGEIGAAKGKSLIGNIKTNANKNLLKTLAFGAIGAISYPLVPTVIQAVTKNDWSGWKGMFTGVGLISTIGLATGKPEMLVGAMSAMGTHLLYAKGTRTIENAFGTQIYRMNPNNIVYADDLQKLSQGTLSDDENSAEQLENPVAHDEVANYDELPEANVMIGRMLAEKLENCSCSEGNCTCNNQDNLTIGEILSKTETENSETETGFVAEKNTATVEKTEEQNALNDLSFGRKRNLNKKRYFYN
jgi:hypothetical protein